MKKILLATLFILFFSVTANSAHAEPKNSTKAYLFKGGDVEILIPPPTDEFLEVGYESNGFLRTVVHGEKLSKGYFVLKADFNEAMDEVNHSTVKFSTSSRFATISVQENIYKFNARQFKEIVESAKDEIGDELDPSTEEPKGVFLKKARSLYQKRQTLGARTSLGRIFSKPNAYGYGVLIKDERENKASYVVAGFAIMRVKEKMLSIYLYAPYKDAGTPVWIQKTTEAWSDAILQANSLREGKVQ